MPVSTSGVMLVAVDGAERRFERPAAGIEDAVRGRCGTPRSRRARRVAGRARWSRRNRPRHRAARSARSRATAARRQPMPTTARAERRDAARTRRAVRRTDFSICRSGVRLGAGDGSATGVAGCFAAQSLQDAFRRERQFAKAHAGRIIDRVGDRGGARHRSGLADAERRLVLPRQHQHVDLGHVGEFDDGVGAPFARASPTCGRTTLPPSARGWSTG